MIPDQPTSWPSAVQDVLNRRVGAVLGSRRLTGLSGRAVIRVEGTDGVVVVKIDPHVRELQFYATRAPVLAALGVSVPTAYYAAGSSSVSDPPGQTWLVLEHLPAPLPRPRWLADPAVLTVLARLHGTVGVLDSIRDPFRPEWSTDATLAAVDRLDPVSRDRLTELSIETEPWLVGTTPISGDPNPRNWGLRADATPALFDWERIGFGHPAVDVGITLPGLPTPEDATAVATAYLKVAGPEAAVALTGPAELARGLRLIKVWTAVELLADSRRGSGIRVTADWLIAHLPAWLASLA